MSKANGFELVVRYEQRKIYSSSTTKLAKWCHGLSVFAALASNHRSELLADNIESTKLAENLKWAYLVSGQWTQTPQKLDDKPLRNTHRRR